MNVIMNSFYIFCIVTLAIATLFFGFKAKQAEGISRMNKIETRYGEGSFTVGLKSTAMYYTYGAFCVISGIGALGLTGLVLDKSKTQGLSELVINDKKVDTTTEGEKTEVVQSAAMPKAEANQNTSTKEEPAASKGQLKDSQKVEPSPIANSGSKPRVTNDNQTIGAPSETTVTSVIQVCESASNFFTQNNCRWEQCAKQENVNRPECATYQRSASSASP